MTKQLQMAYDAQDYTFNCLKAYYASLLNEEGKPAVCKDDALAMAQLTRAFEIAQERVRICRRTPLPGVLKHESKPAKRKGASAQMLVLDPMSEQTGDSSTQSADLPADQSADQATGQAS